MNYQMTPLFFYSFRLILMGAVCLLLAFGGVNAPILYFILLGIVLALWVSLRLHRLADEGPVYLPAQKSEWMVYVQGIPVRETRSALGNPYFQDPLRLQNFFRRFFLIKLLMQMGILLLLLRQLTIFGFDNGYFMMILLAIALLVTGGLLLRIWRTLRMLNAIYQQNWLLEEHQREGITYYRAYFRVLIKRRPTLQPALVELLML